MLCPWPKFDSAQNLAPFLRFTSVASCFLYLQLVAPARLSIEVTLYHHLSFLTVIQDAVETLGRHLMLSDA